MTQQGLWLDKPLWVIDPPDRVSLDAWRSASGASSLLLWCWDWAVARTPRAHAPGAPRFGVWPEGDSVGHPPATVVVYLPRSKDRARWLWSQLARSLPPFGEVVVVGHNRAGIKSVGATLSPAFAMHEKLVSLRHCQVVLARSPQAEAAVAPALSRWSVPASLGGLDVYAYPGVFSASGLDEGTALLLQHLPILTEGRVLDVGCGAGVLGLTLASRAPALVVDLVDSDAFAVASARETAAAAGLARVRVRPSDVYSDAEGRYDLIVSNPPFHQGVDTAYEVGERLVREAPRYLRPGGALLVVCNRFLKIPLWMRETFEEVDELADDGRYRVLLARSPRPASTGQGGGDDVWRATRPSGSGRRA